MLRRQLHRFHPHRVIKVDGGAIENMWCVNESDGTLFWRNARAPNQSTFAQAQSAIANLDGQLFLCTRRTMPRPYASSRLRIFPATSVSRKSRPLWKYVSRLWSIPSRCSIVACRSWTVTGSTTAL